MAWLCLQIGKWTADLWSELLRCPMPPQTHKHESTVYSHLIDTLKHLHESCDLLYPTNHFLQIFFSPNSDRWTFHITPPANHRVVQRVAPSRRCGAKTVLAKLWCACSMAASPTTGDVKSMKPTQFGVARHPRGTQGHPGASGGPRGHPRGSGDVKIWVDVTYARNIGLNVEIELLVEFYICTI